MVKQSQKTVPGVATDKPHLERPTYIFVDTSNIRASCWRSCGFRINFPRFLEYVKKKYPSLKSVEYFEGIADDDNMKRGEHRVLSDLGYEVRPLPRKTYVEPAKYKYSRCPECGKRSRVQTHPVTTKMKSNVDVYLASRMIECAVSSVELPHLVLVSCDGDYAEAIHTILRLRPDAFITVLATPRRTKYQNALSVRLRELSQEIDREHFRLDNINTIKDRIIQGPSRA